MVKMVKLMNAEPTPEGWESKAIGAISNIHRGMSWNADNVTDRPDIGIPVLRIPNVQNKLSLDDLKYLSDISEQDKVRYRVSRGYSIMVGSNGNKDRVGNCCYIEQDMEFVFASFLLACSAKESNDNKYLFYLLTSYPIQEAISSDAATSTGLHNIGLKFIRKREVRVPPLPEQRKIAEILSTVDETIEKTDAIIEETQQLKKGLMQKLFTEGIGHTRLKETKIGRIPEEWEITQLGDLGEFFKGKTITQSDIIATGLPCIRYGDIYVQYENDHIVTDFSAYISRETAENGRRIYSGDILFAGTGETVEDIGKCVAYTRDDEAYAGGDLIVFRPEGKNQLNSIFLAYCLNSGEVARWKSRLGQGSSIFHIYAKTLKTLIVPVPSVNEQHKIAEIFYEVDTKIKAEKAFKAELEQLKKGLMQVLLTGKIRVKV